MNELKDIKKKPALLVLAVIIVITALVYIKAVNHSFVSWDDGRFVYENYFVKNFASNGFSIFFNARKYVSQADPVPLTFFSHAITWYFFPNKPGAFILINILVHLLNVFLVFVFVKMLFKNNLIALIAVAFFAVHPLRVESVVWVSERKDVLYTFFFLSGMIFYLLYLESKKVKLLCIVMILFFLSLFSKLAALIFPLILLLIDFYYKRRDYKRLIIEKIPFIVVAGLFIIMMSFVKQYHHIYSVSVTRFTPIDRIFFVCYTCLYYFYQFYVPHNLDVIHYFPDKLYGYLPYVYYITPVIFLILISGIILLIKKVKLFSRQLLFGIFFFFINLLLVLNITPLSPFAIVAERYTYLAHIGLGIFSAFLILYFFQRFLYLKIVLISCLFLCSSIITYARVGVWKSTFTLFTDSMQKNPTKIIAYIKRGLVYSSENNNEAALKEFEKAVFYKPSSSSTHFQRGVARFKCNKIKDAIIDFDFCIKNKKYLGAMYRYRGSARMILNQPVNALNDWFEAFKNNDKEARKLISDYLKLLEKKW